MVEILEGQYCHLARDDEHHEQDHSVRSEDQKRHEGHAAERHYHLVLEEGLQIEGCKGKRGHVEEPGSELVHCQSHQNREQEDELKVGELVQLCEEGRIEEIDNDEEEEDHHEGKQRIAYPEDELRGAASEIVLELCLVRIQHLLDLCRDYLSLRDDQLPGADKTLSLRDPGGILLIEKLGRFGIIFKVGNHYVVDAGCPEYRIHVLRRRL